MSRLYAVTAEPLNLDALVRTVTTGVGAVAAVELAPGTGAVSAFLGLVRERNLGRRVLRLHYEAFEPLAVRSFQRIGEEARGRWSSVYLGIHHRIGTLQIGEASVAIAAVSPHRAEAFAACRYAIERVKQISPIWKHEFFEGGDVWIEGATADPDDEGAKEHAWRAACA